MGTRAGGEEVVTESDFLFGLRRSDVHHSRVMRALNLHKQEKISIRVLSSAVAETRAVLYSRGQNSSEVGEVFSLMAAILDEYGVDEFVPIEVMDVMIAERMRSEEPSLGFYDSLHGSVAKRLNMRLLSSEGIYSVLDLRVIGLDEF